jgi:hypothetical protein
MLASLFLLAMLHGVLPVAGCLLVVSYQFQIKDEIKAARIEATKAYVSVR